MGRVVFDHSRLLYPAVVLLSLGMFLSSIVSAASGDLLWSFKTGGAIWGDIKSHAGRVYFGSDDGHMYALNVRDQSLLWKFPTGAMVRSAPAITGGKILFSSDDGYLYCLDNRNGELQWRFDLQDADIVRSLPADVAPYDFDWAKSSPVVSGRTVFIGSADGHLYAVNVNTGKLAWKYRAGDRVRGTPAVHGKRVYFSSWDKSVYALNARTGELLWRQQTGDRIVSSPAVIEGKVILGSRDARLYAWDAKTGEPEWTHVYTDGSWVESNAVPGDEHNTLFIGSSDAFKLSKFDVTTGKEIWSFATKGWTWGTPTLSNGTVYIGSTGVDQSWHETVRGFYAVDAATGVQRWGYEPAHVDGYVHGGVHSAPAVSHGQVFVGDVDGTVYVFEE